MIKVINVFFVFLFSISVGFSQTTARVIAESGVKIRRYPSASEGEVTFAPKDAVVSLLEVGSTQEVFEGIRSYWYKVEYTNPENEMYTGYCFGGFLSNTRKAYVTKKQPTQKQPQSQNYSSSNIPYGKAKVITESGCSLRQYPTVNSEKIGFAPQGELLKVILKTKVFETIENKSGYWYKVSYEGKISYCFGGFLKVNF